MFEQSVGETGLQWDKKHKIYDNSLIYKKLRPEFQHIKL